MTRQPPSTRPEGIAIRFALRSWERARNYVVTPDDRVFVLFEMGNYQHGIPHTAKEAWRLVREGPTAREARHHADKVRAALNRAKPD